jgi:hypothetical protein
LKPAAPCFAAIFFNRQKKGASNLSQPAKKRDCGTNLHKPAQTGSNRLKPAQTGSNRHKPAQTALTTNRHKPAQCLCHVMGAAHLPPSHCLLLQSAAGHIHTPSRRGGGPPPHWQCKECGNGALPRGELGHLRCSLILGIIFVVDVIAAQLCCHDRGHFWPLPYPISPSLLSYS